MLLQRINVVLFTFVYFEMQPLRADADCCCEKHQHPLRPVGMDYVRAPRPIEFYSVPTTNNVTHSVSPNELTSTVV